MKYFWITYSYTKACFSRSHSTYEGAITLSIWKVLLHWFYHEQLTVSKVNRLWSAFCYLAIPFFLNCLCYQLLLCLMFPQFCPAAKGNVKQTRCVTSKLNNLVNRLLKWGAGHLTRMMTCFSMAIDSVSEQLKLLLKRCSHEGDKEGSMPLKGQTKLKPRTVSKMLSYPCSWEAWILTLQNTYY